MKTLTVVPFLVALYAAVAWQPLPIYQVNAWNIGTLKIEPWRTRAARAVRAAARSAIAWLARWGRSPLGLAGAAVMLVLLVAHFSASEAGVLSATVAVGGSLSELRARREKLIRDAGECMGPNNTFTPEHRTTFDLIMADIDALGAQLADAERVARVQTFERTTLPETQRVTPAIATAADRAAAISRYEGALNLYLRGVPMTDLTSEQRQELQRGYVAFTAEQRDMSTISGQTGGYLVAPDTRFFGTVIQAMKFFGGMEAAGADVITTDNGADLPMPMGDDTANTGTIVPEEGDHSGGTTPTLKQAILRAYTYSSKTLKVSVQLLQDASIDIETYLGGLMGERHGRIQNTHFTTGDGVNKPTGLVPTASVGRQAAVGNTTTWPFDDVFRTIHSVDVAYRNARCRWQMHDNTVLALRLAKDGSGRYLWPEMGSVQVGQPLTLAGYPVIVNNDMAQMAASAKAASFGDHWYFKIRRVRGLMVVRLAEKYIENGQIGFLSFMRADGGYANAGQNPVKLFQNSAT